MTELKRIPLHFLLASISLLLVISMLFVDIGSTLGASVENEIKDNTYVSEVEVFSGDSLLAAVESCEAAGYTAVKQNINRTSDGDSTSNGIFIVGYKTTTDPDEAITDISLLQMNSGYQDFTYGDVAERAMEKLGNVPTELSYAIEEFAENYSKGSPAAIVAVKILNCFHVDELNNMKLGDYMVSGNCGVDFVKKVLTRSNTAVMSAFCNALVPAVADYGEDNWAQRVYTSSVKDQLASGEDDRKLDIQYKVLANELVDSLQAFASSYTAAAERFAANGNQITEVSAAANETETEMAEETVEAMANGDEIETTDGDAAYLCAYDMLSQYNYDDSTTLADYIVSLGNSSYDDVASLRKIYPLVDSLTDGQHAMMRLCGVAFSTTYLVNQSGLIDEVDKVVSSIKTEIQDNTDGDSLSIWSGTDQTIYNQKVAVTSGAFRANSAGQIYNTLTSPDGVDSFLSTAWYHIGIASTVVGMVWSIGWLTTFVIKTFFVTAFAGMSMWAICSAAIGSGVLSTIFGLIGCTAIVLNYVGLALTIIVLIALLVKYLWDKFTDDDSETFTTIPTVIFDEANSLYVRYDAVNLNGSPANINGDNARRWNALYTTKSKNMGDPIQSSQMDDLIVVQYNNNSTPQGYKPVKCFGEVSAANLNANSRSDSCAVYMYCRTTTTVINGDGDTDTDTDTDTEPDTDADKEPDSSTEEEDKTDTTVQYISKLLLSSEETETAAKAALTKSGYYVLDVNLTPTIDKTYTYIGYTTTTNADDAVTDIRIAARNTSSAYLYGNASYAACGTTPTGDTIYYTSYKSAGTPILADLLVEYSLDEIPEGYEPVNLFCGGNAYNLNMGDEVTNLLFASYSQSSDHWDDTGIYLYFKPSVSYTEGEEYISGFVLVSGKVNSAVNSAESYIQKLKLQKYDLSLTAAEKIALPRQVAGLKEIKHSEEGVETYICYTTTHNPYRAIYGIRSYTAAPGNNSVPVYMGSVTTGAYAVCDILFSLPRSVSTFYDGFSEADGDYRRGVYETHSYQFASGSGSSTGIEQVEMTVELAPEDYEDVSWSSCGARGKGLYVLGPVEGGTPLTVNDIVVTSDTTTPDGFVSVQDFKTPNRTEPHNLGYNTNNSDYIASGKSLTPVYIYQRKAAPVEKQYISSIYVSTYTYSKVAGTTEYTDEQKAAINAGGSDYCVQNLLTQCTDEIIETNVALGSAQSISRNASASPNTVSYIGVSRTSSSKDAITAIIRYVTNQTTVPSTIQVKGVTYTKAGDMIPDPKGSYYLYYTTAYGTNPGKPITNITISEDVFESGCATALSTNGADIPAVKTGTEITQEATKATLYGDVNETTYIHMSFTDTESVMSTIYVGHGKTKKEAQANLLGLGCNICVDLDVNRNAGGEYVYIGYATYTLKTTEIKKGVTKNAVRDIILTVGEEHHSTIEVNGITYKCASDEYSMVKGNDGTKGVSLNMGTGGKQIYLYYSTTITDETTSPISKLGLACMDYGLINDDYNSWEHVFDQNGNRVNLNEGVVATTDDGTHILDNRIYLYASRTNNAVWADKAVDMNSLNKELQSFDVYMKGW